MTTDQLVALLFALVFNLVFYAYLSRLDHVECGCGKQTVDKRSGLLQSTAVVCLIIVGRLLFTTNHAPPLIVSIFMLHFDLVSATQSYRYLREIRDTKCKCNRSITRDLYYYYFVASSCLLGLVLALFYFTLVLLAFK